MSTAIDRGSPSVIGAITVMCAAALRPWPERRNRYLVSAAIMIVAITIMCDLGLSAAIAGVSPSVMDAITVMCAAFA